MTRYEKEAVYLSASFCFVALCLMVLMMPGCTHVPPVPTEPTCRDACDRGRELGCSFAHDTPAGATCEAVCENVQASGIISFDLKCRTLAPSCAAAERCEISGPRETGSRSGPTGDSQKSETPSRLAMDPSPP